MVLGSDNRRVLYFPVLGRGASRNTSAVIGRHKRVAVIPRRSCFFASYPIKISFTMYLLFVIPLPLLRVVQRVQTNICQSERRARAAWRHEQDHSGIGDSWFFAHMIKERDARCRDYWGSKFGFADTDRDDRPFWCVSCLVYTRTVHICLRQTYWLTT